MQRLTYEEIYDRVSALTELATFSSSLTTIMRITKDPSGTAKQLGAAIARDPALTTKILRTVNSCFYAVNREIETIEDAVVVLGFSEVERLALAISVINQFSGRTKRGQALNQLWRHSLVCAVAAETIVEVRRIRSLESSDVYTAALLHDLGKAVLWQYFPDVARGIFHLVERGDIPPIEAERLVMGGATHCEVGAWICSQWSLPSSIVESVQMHHVPEQNPQEEGLTRVIHAADAVCYQVGVPALKLGKASPEDCSAPIPFLGDPEAFYAQFRERWEAKRQTIESVSA